LTTFAETFLTSRLAGLGDGDGGLRSGRWRTGTVGRASGTVPVTGLPDGDEVLLSVGVRTLDSDGAGAAIWWTTDDGLVTVGIADVRGDVVFVTTGCPTVLPAVGWLFLVLVRFCGLCQGSKGDSFGSNALGIVAVLRDVAVVGGSNLGTGRRNARLR
jgi:hypothetical protein